jgi:Sec-independent protein translocase protein TatA
MDPEQMLQRMVDRVVERLALTSEESEVLVPMIKSIYQARTTFRQEMREVTQALNTAVEANDNDQMKAKLDEIKAKSKQQEEKEKAMEKQLVELLTLKQEAVLTLSGVVNGVGGGGMFFGGPRGDRQGAGNRRFPARQRQ